MEFVSTLLIEVKLLISICYKNYIQKLEVIGVLMEDLMVLLMQILYRNK